MIINLRGTSGSGKSTIVQHVMGRYKKIPLVEIGRRQPVGYWCSRDRHKDLTVIGHYETPCGGCDTLKTISQVYDLIRESNRDRFHVLYEGIMVSGETRRCIELKRDGYDIRVIALDVPIQTCIEGIMQRRDAKANFKPFNADRTIRRQREIVRAMERIKMAGIQTEWLNRDEALARVFQLLAEN